jgi:hypothetical protein
MTVSARAAADTPTTIVVTLSVLLAVGAVVYIARLFRRDHKIRWEGRDIRVLVEDVRHVATNESGSPTLRYRLSWEEDGVTRRIEGRETVLARHAPQLKKGREIDIKYLSDDRILFVFDK